MQKPEIPSTERSCDAIQTGVFEGFDANAAARIAATSWACAHVDRYPDPEEFGAKVAQVYRAARAGACLGDDEAAMAVALAALSVRLDMLQATAQPVSLSVHRTVGASPTDQAGSES